MARWIDDICAAFAKLGGEASYDELYQVLSVSRRPPVQGEWKATVRRTVEDYSRDSANFRGEHLLDHVGHGRWRLADTKAQQQIKSSKPLLSDGTQKAPGGEFNTGVEKGPMIKPTASSQDMSTYEAFRDAWLEDVTKDSPTTVQLGNRCGEKIVVDWLDEDESALDIVYCDGTGDGGIDIAVLDRGSISTDEDASSGDTWYLVQSKYGSAFAGSNTLLSEGQKVIDTLDGKRQNLSSLAAGLIERLTNFRNAASAQDRIVLTFATVDPLNEDRQRVLSDIAAMGRARLNIIFDVNAISIKNIYDRLSEEEDLASRRKLTVPIHGNLVSGGDNLLIGSVSLLDLYGFLRAYRAKTGDLDQLYEKNVRRFLGGKVRVNKIMHSTLREFPEKFGLFNNGITIVVSNYTEGGGGVVNLEEPYIVNGCQTTRTIWETCYNRLDAGGTGKDTSLDEWRQKLAQGCVVTKIAKVGTDGEVLLQEITRFTNSQNAVRDKDFIAISGDFKAWHSSLASKFDLYLEIQRGGWDSQRALQKQNPNLHSFSVHANAAELIKVYGAGWLGEVGTAFGKNPPFLPNGAVFKKITAYDANADDRAFGADDLYAAYLLQQSSQENQFGRGGPIPRRQTKFLFYMIMINLLRDVLQKEQKKWSNGAVSSAVISLLKPINDGGRELIYNAIQIIDTYMVVGDENCIHNEPAFQTFNGDLNAFLKWEQLGKSLEQTPRLQALLFFQKQFMSKSQSNTKSSRAVISSFLP